MTFESCRMCPFAFQIASIGHIYPDNTGCLPYVGPPQDIALELINRQYDGVFNFTLSYNFDRNLRSCAEVADHAVDLLSRWYYRARSNRIVPALVFPCKINTHYVLRDKSQSPTFVSVGHYASTAYLEFYSAIMPLFQWRSVFVLAVESTRVALLYGIVARTAVQAMSTLPNQLVTTRYIEDPVATTFQQILPDFRRISRVMLYFGRAEGLRLLLIEAYHLNMTNGDYVYIALENFASPSLYGRIGWDYGDESDQVARRAFHSLLVVRPVDFNDSLPSSIRGFTPAELSRRAFADYNFALPLANQPLVNLISPFLSINLLGQILNTSHSVYGPSSLYDGAHLAKMVFNQTFETVFGPIEMDDVGQRIVDLTLSWFDEHNDNFQPFLLMKMKSKTVTSSAEVRWVDGKPWPPPNEPLCGYSDQSSRCGNTRSGLYSFEIAVPVVSATLGSLCCAIYFIRRYFCFERNPAQMWWIVERTEIMLTEKILAFRLSQVSRGGGA
ncbi:putative Atrial natriuretic peptide receptor 1 [Hypsibius exemplaris]|uniref:Atrial natriuretic peptide receptor 1 n=1 Tax=Hypsibius exemplaris TaxID=2072580 RepID=A0A1W0WDW0_HYPEX|nr:putative Atrial natriuretic peptide receptor 1 [Hypsibius exemplaris]